MHIDDDTIYCIKESFRTADAFLSRLAQGDGFSISEYQCFIDSLEANRDAFSKLPLEIRDIVTAVLEIPMLMQNSINIVDVADREKFEEATVNLQNLLCDLFSKHSDDQDKTLLFK